MSKTLEQKIEKKLHRLGFWNFPYLKALSPQVLKADGNECMLKFKLQKFTKDEHKQFFAGAMDSCSQMTLKAFSFYVLLLDKRKLKLNIRSTLIQHLSECNSSLRICLLNAEDLLHAIEEASHTQSPAQVEVHLSAYNESNDIVAEIQHNISISL